MAPQASRRFHEAGVGSRTGLRLSAVARDQDGFEDLEAFYKASEAALEQGQQSVDGQYGQDYSVEDDEYDSFDETRFSRRSGVQGKVARHTLGGPSSSSLTMDLQNSSAPSPRSMLRSIRPSAIDTALAGRNARGKVANITMADDDDDDDNDLDLPNLSNGSRSFDLAGMAGDDDDGADHTMMAKEPVSPRKGLSARQARASGTTSKASAKGKEKAPTLGRSRLDLSDSEDDRILADLRRRIDTAYGNDDDDDLMGDYDDEVPAPVPPKPRPPPKPKSPARASSARKRTVPTTKHSSMEQRSQLVQSQPYASGPFPAAAAAPSPKRNTARPAKSRAAQPPPPPEPQPTYEAGYHGYGDYDEYDEYDEPATLPARSPSPVPRTTAAAKRKRERAPTSAATTARTTNGTTASSSKPKTKSQPQSKPTAKSKGSTNEVVQKVRSQPTVTTTIYDENGVRRSTRQRFAPLEYWRGERIRYGRPSLPSGTTLDDIRRSQRPGEDEFEEDPSMMLVRRRVPVLDIKEVIRVPRAPGEGTFAETTNRARNRRNKLDRKSEDQSPRFASETPDPSFPGELHLDPTADTVHFEDGWDSKTVENGIIIDDEDGSEVQTSIVRTKASLTPLTAAGQDFRFEKLFNCGGLMATGVLELPPGTRKPTKPSKDNSFVFCVLQGALRATVHRKSFIVGPEGVFQVPAGNTYALENICERDVKLFFAQCRKTKKVAEGDLTTFTQVSDTSYGTPQLSMIARPVLGGKERSAGFGSEAGQIQTSREEKVRSRKAHMLTEDSDAEDGSEEREQEEDDFETSRKGKKAKKKRIFKRY